MTQKELEELSEVTDKDVKEAIAKWQKNPPEKQFKNLINPEIIENE